MPKVFKKVRANQGPGANPSKPLAAASRELFCQHIVRGTKAQDAYRLAGYEGGESTRRQLRNMPDIANRISYLMEARIDADNAHRHKREKSPTNIQDFVTKRLMNIAGNDIRNLIQWRTIPILNDDGSIALNPDGSPQTETIQIITPSHKLTAAQASGIKKVSKKNGELNVEAHDPLPALTLLARSVGMLAADAPPQTVNNTVNQLNIGQQNAGDAIKRLAFALQKLAHNQTLIDVTPVSHAIEHETKE